MVIGSAATGDGGASHSARHRLSCADEVAYTMRPRPTQACPAAHIGQCSPEVYTVALARSSGVRFCTAHLAIANSGWRVWSPSLMRLRSS